MSDPDLKLDLKPDPKSTQLEKARALTHRCLMLSIQSQRLQPLLDAFVQEIKTYVGCDAVGIRIRDDAGWIPYQAFDGFSERFYLSESPLSLNTDQCMCIDVIGGKTDPSLPFFTAGGSFFINGTSRFLETVSEEEKGQTRNMCNMEGFESVALIPIVMGQGIMGQGITGQGIMGLIHAADSRENMAPLEVVEALENVAIHLGMALQKIHLEEELRTSVRELRFLSSRLLTIQEEERSRISLGIHDELGQDLSVLKLRLSAIRNRLRKDQKHLQSECDALLGFTDEVIGNIRRLSYDLHPSFVEGLGLNAAIRQLIREHAELTGIEIEDEIADLNDLFDNKAGAMIYRIVQEALQNIRRHARADTVGIIVQKRDDQVLFKIRDDGRGFPTVVAGKGEGLPGGMGMLAMKSRARVIGADFSISSRPGKGTEVFLSIPAGGNKGNDG